MRLVRCFLASAMVIALGGCGVLQVRTSDGRSATEETTPKDEERREGEVPIDDVASKVEEILARPPTDEALEGLASARLELLRRRAAVLEDRAAKIEAARGPSSAPYPSGETPVDLAWRKGSPLGPDGARLLRRIHLARARMYLDQHKDFEALSEVMPPEGIDLEYVPLLDCEKEETACSDVKARILARWPTLCSSMNDLAQCRLGGEWQLGSGKDLHTLPMLMRFIVTKVVGKRNDGVTVLGFDYAPKDVERCHGQFETDKILDVDESRILVERTTWCRSITKGRARGVRNVYELPPLPVDVARGTEVIAVLEPGGVGTRPAGETDVVTVKRMRVLATRSSKLDGLRWNQRLPASVLRWENEIRF